MHDHRVKASVIAVFLFVGAYFEPICTAGLAQGELPAFPGAEGFGANTPGGRGGQVFYVENLNDSGPGSFRAACEESGPRIVLFRTGGTITLHDAIKITDPYITIAGQTAPGDGICLRGASLSIKTHDVVVRGLRIRVGDDPAGQTPSNRDGISIGSKDTTSVYNIIFDHCSISWGIDENVGTWYSGHDITFQWCIISEALDSSLHEKGAHSKGMLIGYKSTRISIHHNLFAHNVERNPRLQGGRIDFVNNVVYNAVRTPGYFADDYAALFVNYIGNTILAGPDSEYDRAVRLKSIGDGTSVYLNDNFGPYREHAELDDAELVSQWEHNLLVMRRHPGPPLTIARADRAFDSVLTGAGATIPERDLVDMRIAASVKNRSGGIIDSQDDSGAWPALRTGSPVIDSDGDGMPDNWELQHGFDILNPADGRLDANSNGYTNVEEYINALFLSKQIRTEIAQAPQKMSGPVLERNYPNPFNPATTIRYFLHEAGEVALSVYDVNGREVARLEGGPRTKGRHEAVWESGPYPSGLYFVRLQMGKHVLTRKVQLVR